MYEWIPKRTNKRVQNAILLLLIGAAVVLLFPMLLKTDAYRWIFQLLSIVCLTAVIFLITRYHSKIFIYCIRERDDETEDLTVTEAKPNGKGQITVCRVGVGRIRLCRVLDEQKDPCAREILKTLRKKRKKLFDYCIDLHPAQCILLAVEESGEELWLTLSYSPELVARLGGERELEDFLNE